MPRHKSTSPGPNPSGLCQCGCGQPTKIARCSDKRYGSVIGQPCSYINGHHRRLSYLEWKEEDRGYVTPCWIWQRGKSSNGYGTAMGQSGKTTTAHRVIYERVVGPVPKGLVLDHLCRQKDCVNPSHTEPVTDKENIERGVMPAMLAHKNGTCLRGHPLTGKNLHIFPNGRRSCRVCLDAENQRTRERRRVARLR